MLTKLILAPLLLVAGALGQATVINTPKPGTRLTSGQNFTLQVLRAFTRSGSLEIGYGVGLWPCGSSPCPAPGVPAGNILYNGPYVPTFQDIPGTPYQNFTLNIPPAGQFPKGVAQISTLRLHVMGPSAFSIYETLGVQVEIV